LSTKAVLDGVRVRLLIAQKFLAKIDQGGGGLGISGDRVCDRRLHGREFFRAD
jgi:hypothetical protein